MTDSERFYKKLLKNERSFDSLFCDERRLNYGTLYYNQTFQEDIVFNHFVFDDSVLESENKINPSEVIDSIRGEDQALGILSSLFVEDYWRGRQRFEKAAVEEGYLVFEQMDVMAKELEPTGTLETKEGILVDITGEIESWNEVFMNSFSIPLSWQKELIERERSFIGSGSTVLLVAKEKGVSQGCLLLHQYPEEIAGVYCVGTMPEKRNRGIASAMLSFAERTSRIKGCKVMTLQTLGRDNVTPMYEKIGYRVQFHRDVMQRPA